MNQSIPLFVNTFTAPTGAANQNAQPIQLRAPITQRADLLQYTIWFLACALKGAGGTDYTTKLTGSTTGTLRRDCKNALTGFDRNMVAACEAFIWYNAAIDLQGGGTTGTTAKQWTVNTAILNDLSIDELMSMRLFLMDNLLAKKL